MATYGVYSEVGKLRKVLVHRPDLSLKRLTPSNFQELLFDDVLCVKKARWEHDVFIDHMRAWCRSAAHGRLAGRDAAQSRSKKLGA